MGGGQRDDHPRGHRKGGAGPLNVLALRDKKLVNDQTILEPEDEIRLVNVISGG